MTNRKLLIDTLIQDLQIIPQLNQANQEGL